MTGEIDYLKLAVAVAGGVFAGGLALMLLASLYATQPAAAITIGALVIAVGALFGTPREGRSRSSDAHGPRS